MCSKEQAFFMLCLHFWFSLSFADVLPSLLYVIDVVSDIWSVMSLFQGAPINATMFGNPNFTSYNEDLCNNLENYSHHFWGMGGVVCLWLPAVPLVQQIRTKVFETLAIVCSCSSKTKFFENVLTIFLQIIALITWPITGLIM